MYIKLIIATTKMFYLPIFRILILASAGISSSSSSESVLKTEATVGFFTSVGLLAGPMMFILIGALGLDKSMDILLIRGGGGGAGTSGSIPSPVSLVADGLLLGSHIDDDLLVSSISERKKT